MFRVNLLKFFYETPHRLSRKEIKESEVPICLQLSLRRSIAHKWSAFLAVICLLDLSMQQFLLLFFGNQGEATPSHGYKNHWNCKWIDMESKKWANFLGATNAPSNLLAVSHAGDAYKLEPPLRGCQVAIVWHLKCQK